MNNFFVRSAEKVLKYYEQYNIEKKVFKTVVLGSAHPFFKNRQYKNVSDNIEDDVIETVLTQDNTTKMKTVLGYNRLPPVCQTESKHQSDVVLQLLAAAP